MKPIRHHQETVPVMFSIEEASAMVAGFRSLRDGRRPPLPVEAQAQASNDDVRHQRHAGSRAAGVRHGVFSRGSCP